MDAPRALVFRPLVKGNEALGTRLKSEWKFTMWDIANGTTSGGQAIPWIAALLCREIKQTLYLSSPPKTNPINAALA